MKIKNLMNKITIYVCVWLSLKKKKKNNIDYWCNINKNYLLWEYVAIGL